MAKLLKVLVALAGLHLISPLAVHGAAEPPPNDDFANASELPTPPEPNVEMLIFGDNSLATLEPGEAENPEIAPYAANGSVWWKWTAPTPGNAMINFKLTRTETTIGVFTGTGIQDLRVVFPPQRSFGSCDDDGCWPIGFAAFRALKGVTYYFAVLGEVNSPRPQGPLAGEFYFEPLAGLEHEIFEERLPLEGTNLTVPGNNYRAVEEEFEPIAIPEGELRHSLWYTWRAPERGVLRVRVIGHWSHYVTLYRGEALRDLTPLSLSGPNSGSVLVEEGDQVEIAVQTFYQSSPAIGGPPGAFTLYLEFEAREDAPVPPVNDPFSAAISIANTPFSREGTLLGATREPGEPASPGGDEAPETSWWSFTSVHSGLLSIEVHADSWRPRIIGYSGSQLGSLAWMGTSEDGKLELETEAGAQYRLQLTGVNLPGERDVFTLVANFTPTFENDHFSDSVPLEDVVHSVHGYVAPSTMEPGEPRANTQVKGTVWWSWAAPADGMLLITPAWINECGWDGSARFAVYTGPAVNKLQRIALSRENHEGPASIGVRQGVVYHIQVWVRDHTRLERTGFTLEFSPYLPADNDHFAQAAPVDGVLRSTLGATREIGEPAHRAGGPNKSLWWKWTAAMNHQPLLVASSFVGDTVPGVTLAVYQGTTVDTLRLVAKGMDQLWIDAWATEVYYIAAEVPEPALGFIDLSLNGGLPSGGTRSIPGNLIQNPSFEKLGNEAFADWLGEHGGAVNAPAPDGGNYASFGYIYQDIPTTAGNSYRLRFSYSNDGGFETAFNIWFGGTHVAYVEVPMMCCTAYAAEFIVTAREDISRLEFRGTANLDQVSLVNLSTPPAIVQEPADLTVFAGAEALFHAGITGAEPLTYQWFHNGEAIAGATDPTLHLPVVTAAEAGTYYITATNPHGDARSTDAILRVESASSPQFVLQPAGDRLFAGQFFVLQAAAVGTPPLRYQWFRNGVPLPGMTNSALEFASFSAEQTGAYHVQVANGAETAASLAATLSLTTDIPEGGGAILFANYWIAGPEGSHVAAPVFDLDGITRLSGGDYVAQLYAGRSADSLRPVGEPRHFLQGFQQGYWQFGSVVLPHIAPLEEAFVQVRAWDRKAGASYETARALGGKFGRSATFTIIAAQPSDPPGWLEGAPLIGLEPFTLRAGLPNFVTGILSLAGQTPEGEMTWTLTGAPGFRYLVERKTDGHQWLPFKVISNDTGTTTFTDAPSAEATIQLYRARMLD